MLIYYMCRQIPWYKLKHMEKESSILTAHKTGWIIIFLSKVLSGEERKYQALHRSLQLIPGLD